MPEHIKPSNEPDHDGDCPEDPDHDGDRPEEPSKRHHGKWAEDATAEARLALAIAALIEATRH
jgi:hypothetical protein